MVVILRQLSDRRLRQRAGIEKSDIFRKGYSCHMGEKTKLEYMVCKIGIGMTTHVHADKYIHSRSSPTKVSKALTKLSAKANT